MIFQAQDDNIDLRTRQRPTPVAIPTIEHLNLCSYTTIHNLYCGGGAGVFDATPLMSARHLAGGRQAEANRQLHIGFHDSTSERRALFLTTLSTTTLSGNTTYYFRARVSYSRVNGSTVGFDNDKRQRRATRDSMFPRTLTVNLGENGFGGTATVCKFRPTTNRLVLQRRLSGSKGWLSLRRNQHPINRANAVGNNNIASSLVIGNYLQSICQQFVPAVNAVI